MKRIILPNGDFTHVDWRNLFNQKNKAIFYMRSAIEIPWEDLPKYINHSDALIKAIIELRLKGLILSDPGVQISISSQGEDIIETYVMAED